MTVVDADVYNGDDNKVWHPCVLDGVTNYDNIKVQERLRNRNANDFYAQYIVPLPAIRGEKELHVDAVRVQIADADNNNYVNMVKVSQYNYNSTRQIAIFTEGFKSQQMVEKAFNEMSMHRILAVINEDNTASVRCFTKAGFALEGRHREARFTNGEYKDVLFFSILEHEWHKKRLIAGEL